jgi:hypothetical protein
MQEPNNPHAGTELLTKIFDGCKDLAKSEDEVKEIEAMIARLRILEENGRPWPIPSKLLILVVNSLPKDVQLSEPIVRMLENPRAYDKIKKRIFLNKFLKDIAPSKVNRCANDLCGNVDNLKSCMGCQIFTYCSTECQRLDWKNHKAVCKSCCYLKKK